MVVIDLAMVGRLGNNAIAALGLAVFSNTLITSFVAGIAPAVQGLVARRRGEGSAESKCLPLNAGLLLALLAGSPLAFICYLLTPALFSLVSSDVEVTKIGIPFLRCLYLGIIAVGMNGAFKGFWAGIEKPKIFMLIVLFMNCLNTVLNYILIFGHFGMPALGATGAGISTVVSLYTGVIVNFFILYFGFRKDAFTTMKVETPVLTRIFKLGLPATMQDFFLAASYIIFFWMVGQIGAVELAAANVLVRITMILFLLAVSLGMASATLVSKAAGEGDFAGAAQWGWDVGKLGVISITVLGLPLLLFPEAFLSIFLTDPHAVSIAVVPLRIVAATSGIGSMIYILAYTLYSVGDGKRVTIVSFGTQWIFCLPAVWIVGPYLKYGLSQIWMVQMANGIIGSALITAIWADGRWKKIKI
jgi:multidrug resistance protein, MATE family